jgi:PPOX class probable F420-dependent enzyme
MGQAAQTSPSGGLRIDEGGQFGARAARHLRDDPVVWLTTVGAAGAPSPNPVWFLWDGAATVRLFSLPEAARVRHVAANPHVSLNFPGDGQGGDIVVLNGTAELRPEDPQADRVPGYLAKYAGHIARIGLTPTTFARRYSLPITITLSRLRGH